MKFDFTLLIFALFVAEQIVMVKVGSYPYLWGIPFARRTLPNNLKIEDVGGFIGRLKVKKDEEGNIFFRYKHFPFTWGPYVFVGQASKEDPTILIIRLGPLTCIFFIGFILQGLFSGLYSTIVSLIIINFFLWYFFYSFLIGYEKMLSKGMTKI